MAKFAMDRTIRTACLCVISIGLLTLIVSIYSDHYKSQLCANSAKVQREQSQLQQDGSSNAAVEQVLRDEQLALNRSDLPPWNYNWDMKASETNELSKGTKDRTMVLIRHGQYNLNTGKLTDMGRRQAAMTGLRLKEMNISFHSITHSTLERAMETAQIISGYLPNVPIGKDDLLVEGGPIPPNPTITYWKLPERSYHTDGPRLEAAFRKYFYRPTADLKSSSFEILVGHGNIFRFFSLRALQLSKDAWMRVFIAHASITMIHLRPDGTVSMSKFGDAGHFPHKEVTY